MPIGGRAARHLDLDIEELRRAMKGVCRERVRASQRALAEKTFTALSAAR